MINSMIFKLYYIFEKYILKIKLIIMEYNI